MSPEKITYRQRFERVLYFFPIQLVILHLKKNHLLLLCWFILFGYITKGLAAKYGVFALFLYPEYLGQVNFWSFGLVGFAMGGFVMAFNIYTYIIHAFRFPFLATLSKPFYKFSINNFIIPLIFIGVYFYYSIIFQYHAEFVAPMEIAINILGFITGIILFFILSFFYFFKTNKDIFKMSGNAFEPGDPSPNKGPSVRAKTSWFFTRARNTKWKVLTYMKNFSQINLARDSSHYDKELLRKVFAQNHINASLFEILLVLTFILVGSFKEFEIFKIPAAASAILFVTLFLMIISIFLSWVRGWTLTLLVVVFFAFNYLSSDFQFFSMQNYLYGMEYETSPVEYSEQNIYEHSSDALTYLEDVEYTKEILENWKQKMLLLQPDVPKPKMIIVNTSGGGLRSSLWTYRNLQYLDSLTAGQFMDQVFMINGSSGGMIGASLLRELKLRSVDEPYYNDRDPLSQISSDLLNPILFSIATNDAFIGWSSFHVGNKTYPEDRAYAFEQQFHRNTKFVLDKKMSDYREPEYNAEIPMMILSPTIIQDGRRLIMSPQPVSYLCYTENVLNLEKNPLAENIEFGRMFADHGADDILYLSALRANATFPYILPQASLPTLPRMELMDSGIRDNFGYKTTFQFMSTFQTWLEENTSGVIILVIRDKQKELRDNLERKSSVLNRLLSPLGNLYGNFTTIQDFTHDQMLNLMDPWVKDNLEEITLQLEQDPKNNISLSWHLTSREKQTILQSVLKQENQKARDHLLSQISVPKAVTSITNESTAQ